MKERKKEELNSGNARNSKMDRRVPRMYKEEEKGERKLPTEENKERKTKNGTRAESESRDEETENKRRRRKEEGRSKGGGGDAFLLVHILEEVYDVIMVWWAELPC